jgi:hypothetical protein
MSTTLTDSMRARIQHMGFRGILLLAARSLHNREFLSWLMDRFNPENMMIEIGCGKWIEITENAIRCVLGLPSSGVDPPVLSDDSGKKILKEAATRLIPDVPEPRDNKTLPSKAADMIEHYHRNGWPHLDEELCISIFYKVLNSNFLTPNISFYLRPIDALWCQDNGSIAGYNWCKVVYDNLRVSGRKWKVSRQLGMEKPAILGPSLFLMVSFVFQFSSIQFTFMYTP